jgi:hypothetical protein
VEIGSAHAYSCLGLLLSVLNKCLPSRLRSIHPLSRHRRLRRRIGTTGSRLRFRRVPSPT